MLSDLDIAKEIVRIAHGEVATGKCGIVRLGRFRSRLRPALQRYEADPGGPHRSAILGDASNSPLAGAAPIDLVIGLQLSVNACQNGGGSAAEALGDVTE